MAISLETQRLRLRDWLPDEQAEQALLIYGDPVVMRYIGTGATAEGVDEVRCRLHKRNAHIAKLNNGTGFWAIVDKRSEILGTVILKQLPDASEQLTQDWEVGWHLKRSAWGNGYATEAARAVLNYGFKTLKLPIIYAVANPENQASIRVMQRLAMSPLGRTHKYYGVETELFELRAENFYC